MSLGEKIIEELENKLIERKNKLKKELEIIAEPTDEEGDYKAKFENIGEHRDENATEVEGFVENTAVKEKLEEQLENVKIALDKIKNGNYGICEECGGEIKEARLKIYPSARRCMKCAQ